MQTLHITCSNDSWGTTRLIDRHLHILPFGSAGGGDVDGAMMFGWQNIVMMPT